MKLNPKVFRKAASFINSFQDEASLVPGDNSDDITIMGMCGAIEYAIEHVNSKFEYQMYVEHKMYMAIFFNPKKLYHGFWLESLTYKNQEYRRLFLLFLAEQLEDDLGRKWKKISKRNR
jgi:hypothetical protein